MILHTKNDTDYKGNYILTSTRDTYADLIIWKLSFIWLLYAWDVSDNINMRLPHLAFANYKNVNNSFT